MGMLTDYNYEVTVRRNGDVDIKWPTRGWVNIGRVKRLGPRAWELVVPEIWSVWGSVKHVYRVGPTRYSVVNHAVMHARQSGYVPNR